MKYLFLFFSKLMDSYLKIYFQLVFFQLIIILDFSLQYKIYFVNHINYLYTQYYFLKYNKGIYKNINKFFLYIFNLTTN